MDTVLSGMFDTHPLFEIDPSTREIIIVEGSNTIAVQYDKNSQLVTFRVPRYFDNIDHLGQTAKIKYLNSKNQGDRVDAYSVEEDVTDNGYILVSWLVGDTATQAAGQIRVSLEFCVLENNEYVYRWSTKTGKFLIAENINVTDQNTGVTPTPLVREEIAALTKRVAEVEEDIDDLKYVVISITSISNTAGIQELGRIIDTLTINWSLNKDPVEQSVGDLDVAVNERAFTLSDLGIGQAKTFTVKVKDERGAVATASTTVSFFNGIYYGVLDDGDPIDSGAVLSLQKKLQSGKATTFSANAGKSQRIAFALPSRYGTPNFNVGGFDGGFSKTATIEFTNASDYTEDYDVWISDNMGLGSTTVKVT